MHISIGCIGFFFSGSWLRSKAWLHKKGLENGCLGSAVCQSNAAAESEVKIVFLTMPRSRTCA